MDYKIEYENSVQRSSNVTLTVVVLHCTANGGTTLIPLTIIKYDDCNDGISYKYECYEYTAYSSQELDYEDVIKSLMGEPTTPKIEWEHP